MIVGMKIVESIMRQQPMEKQPTKPLSRVFRLSEGSSACTCSISLHAIPTRSELQGRRAPQLEMIVLWTHCSE